MSGRISGYCIGVCLLLFLSGCTNSHSDVVFQETPVIPTQLPVITLRSTEVSTPASSTLEVTSTPATATVEPMATIEPTATTAIIQRLVVCIAEPPVPLNPYTNVSMSRTVLQAINDGPVDYVQFTYQPILLESLPIVDTGEVIVQEVTVHDGDLVFDPQTNSVQEHIGPDINMEQMVVYFPLRTDVEWSDGTPLTAYDSLYAYQLFVESATESVLDWQLPSQRLVLQTADYYVVDEYTVKWTGIPGLISVDYPKFFFHPVPRHQETDLHTYWPTVGWGAFNIEAWIPGQHLLMTRNLNYFRENEGLPNIHEVEFRFLEPPYGSLPDKISKEGCHIISLSVAQSMLAEEWLAASSQNDFHLVSSPGTTGWQLVFNLDERRITSNLEIRRVITMCLDRSGLADLFQSMVAASYVHPDEPAYIDPGLPEFDQQEGRISLAEIGWDTPILQLLLRDSPGRHLIGDKIEADLAECGITVETTYLDAESFLRPWPEGPLFGGMYDMTVMALNAADGPACNWYLSENVPSEGMPEGLNVARFQNAEFDQLCREALITLAERERIRLHQEAQMVWGGSISSLPLFWSMLYTGVDCHVQGYEIDPTGVELWNIEEMELTKECYP